MMNPTPRRVPVILVAGFLGSGKSTLLNHLLRNSGHTRIGLIINDFGAINVDALLVAGQVDGVVGLSNGCMCCTVDDDSPDGLAAVVQRLLAPRAGIDAIVIEASGLAEPRSLIAMVAALTDPRIVYGGLVYLIDAGEFLATRSRHPEIDGHVRVADLLVVNKADLVSDRQPVIDAITELNSTAPLVATTDSVVDPAMLFDPVEARGGDDSTARQLSLDELLRDAQAHDAAHVCGEDCATHRHLHDEYQSVSFESARPLNPRRLAAFLERPPVGTYRIKGWAHFDLPGHRGRFVIHAVGGRIRVDQGPGTPGVESGGAPTSIVVIGAGVDEAAVRAELTACVGVDPDDEFGVLSITRYLPQTQAPPRTR